MSTQGSLSIGLRARPCRRVLHAAVALIAAGACATLLAPASAPALPAATDPVVTFTLLTPPLPTVLAVGQRAEIGVRVESSEPFLMAIALSDAYFPGRSVRFDGSAAQPNATSADLYLTLTGTKSTASLPGAVGWPADEIWPAGVAPLAVRVGARFTGGRIIGTSYVFSVTVP